jgi:zinc transporter 5/7
MLPSVTLSCPEIEGRYHYQSLARGHRTLPSQATNSISLLSLEITFEAFERIWEGSPPKRLGELLVVSILGMLVNLVGMVAFGHHHHHHGHSHSHDHSQDGNCTPHSSHGHSHGHDNENMHGIYLHVLADTLGSASVVVSTILTSTTGWAGWDPVASIFISALILGSSKPLVVSSAKRLILSIPTDTEYTLRNTLAGIGQQRGVVGCSVPKFWVDDRGTGRDNKLLGIVHVVAAHGASLDDVRERVREYLLRNGMDAVVQVEREGDNLCWCSSGRVPTTPLVRPL